MSTTTVVTKCTGGTFVRSDKPSSIFYSAAKTNMFVRTGGPYVLSYFRCALPAQLLGRQVLSADLGVATFPGASRDLILYELDKLDVTGAALPAFPSMTYNRRGTQLPGSTIHTDGPSTAGTRHFDVTDELQEIANGRTHYGWRLSTTYTAADWKLYGWGGSFIPTLTVVLGDTPSAPTGITPQGITSLAKPHMSWDGPDGIISVQVQVDEADGDFSSPAFDSGTVAHLTPDLDLAGTAFSGLTGTDVDMRIRHTTPIGTSAWSDTIRVHRVTPPTLDITSPSSTTTDPTPPVAWDTDDQLRFQLTTFVNGAAVYDSGIVAGDDDARTPDKGATKNGQIITNRVRVWWSNDIHPSPGDPGYLESSEDTTYTPGSATAISTITGGQAGQLPWADIAWTRTAGLADEWLIERDTGGGYEILDRILGTIAGEAQWSYRDVSCPPNVDVTYRVRPMVSGAAGAVGPTVTVRTAVTGAWIYDPGNPAIYVRFAGSDFTIAYAEQTVWYEPIGAPAPVKTTFALRGLEGTIGGSMRDYAGRSLTAYEADLFTIKANPTGTYRMVFGDQNIPVLLDNITDVIHPDMSTTKKRVKQVSMNFRQNGELPFPVVAP